MIIDYKSSEVSEQEKADKKAKESLQLKMYSLAYKEMFGKVPDRVELHFLESGLIGKTKSAEKDLDEAMESIEQAAEKPSCRHRPRRRFLPRRSGTCKGFGIHHHINREPYSADRNRGDSGAFHDRIRL